MLQQQGHLLEQEYDEKEAKEFTLIWKN